MPSINETIQMIDLYNQGYSLKDISKLFSKTKSTIHRRLKDKVVFRKNTDYPRTDNQKYRTKRKFSINQNFFDTIDTQEKAYILGLLYADGYVSETNTYISLALHNKDNHILEQINTVTLNECPIRDKKQMRVLNIYSKKMVERLVELGCGQAKTFKLKFPTEEQVPSYLIHHFIRGYFDGDGCIYVSNTNNNRMFHLIGFDLFLVEVQSILIKKCFLNKTKFYYPPRSDDRIAELKFCGRNQCIKIRDWLYQDASIFLQRKYNKFYSI